MRSHRIPRTIGGETSSVARGAGRRELAPPPCPHESTGLFRPITGIVVALSSLGLMPCTAASAHEVRTAPAEDGAIGGLRPTLDIDSPSAPSADEVTTALDLSGLIAAALQNNKSLQAQRFAADIGRARVRQAGALPNPRLNVNGASDFAFRSEGAYSSGVGVAQDIPVAGRIRRKTEVARIELDRSLAEIEDAERRLAGEVTTNVYRLLVVDLEIEARDRLIVVDERLARVAQSRFRAAEVSELDVNTVTLDLQRLRQERAILQSQRGSLLVSLNQLIGRPVSAALRISEPVPPYAVGENLEQLQAKALVSRPDLKVATFEADRAGAEKALAKAERWEDWNVGLGVQQDRQIISGAPPQDLDRALGFSLSIPLPLWNRNQGMIAIAQASAGQADAQIEALKAQITGEVASAYNEASSLQRLLAEYQQTTSRVSERSVALAQKGYSEGLVSVLEVVQAQRQQGDLNTSYLATLDQYLQTLARLRTAVGDYPGHTVTSSGTATTEGH